MKITFQIENSAPVIIEANPGDNLLEVARRANVAIDAPCSGNGSCGKCRVKLLSGEVDSLPSRHITAEEYAEGWRLSCCAKVLTDATVFVPDIASAYRSRMRTADLSSLREIAIFEDCRRGLLASGITLENNLCCAVLTLAAPTLDDTLPDNERLVSALQQALGAETIRIPHCVMKHLAHRLRKYNFHVAVKGRLEDDTFTCLDICDPADMRLLGCAIDIGTTTVTAVLCDMQSGEILAKASSGNGQIRYGADVINRIIQQGRPGGVEKLQKAVVEETLVPILAALCAEAKADCPQILQLAIASNTTMNHLLVGVDAESVRLEPYIPSFFAWEDLKAADIGLCACPEARVILAPNIGSYVGGDITAGTLAAGFWDSDEMSLFIDLGTNGELVFGNRDFLMSCACSAGPAFEGGDISCGMRATDGAIEAVFIDSATMEPRFSVIGGGKPVGLCGSGIIDLIAGLFTAGIIDPRGLFIREGRRVARDRHGMGRYILAFPGESETGREVAITEVDIDNFIRAKGAIYSAIDTLLQAVDLDESCIERVYVAGGIGSGINMKNAVTIGMLPAVELEKFRYIGNSSLTGAYAMVMSRSAQAQVAAIAANMTYLELSTHPGYMDNFVAACFLPHTDSARFPRRAAGVNS